ncbi:MAG TPA: hypothetical protein IAB64_03795 [Candidatus Coproplasma excrementavium]|nr:hypothetical protein [Candidatus Coproplasma excrementavium]
MGLFSKLFGCKKNKNSNSISVEIHSSSEQIPQYQGDYAKTIFLYKHSRAMPLKKNDEYQKFFLYELGIRNPRKYHLELIKQGLLIESNLNDKLEALTVNQLKCLMNDLNIAVSGAKSSLIEKAKRSDNVDTIIDKYYSNQPFSLSEKGVQFINEHNHYILLWKHKNWSISWQEYDETVRSTQYKKSFYDIVWGIFNKRILHSTNFGYDGYINMYELLCEENKMPEALQILLLILSLDVSGTIYQPPFQSYFYKLMSKQELIDKTNVAISEHYIKELPKYKKYIDFEIIDKSYNDKLPIQICDKDLFTEIITEGINETINLKKYNSILTENYKKQIPIIIKNKNLCKLLGLKVD